MIPRENPLFRAFAIAGIAALGGIAIWASLPQPLEDPGSSIVRPQTDLSDQRAKLLRASFMRTEADQIAAASNGSNRCTPWSISAPEMEIILQEMIRRGWQPPSRRMALADLGTVSSGLFPLDPDAPMPVRDPRTPQITEDGPIPPTPPEALETNPPVTVTTTTTPPVATTATAPSAAEPAAPPQPPPH